MSASVLEPAVAAPAAPRSVVIDFLYLDLNTCDRCIGTNVNLDAALEEVAGLLAAAGVQVDVRKHLVAAEAQARDLGFVSSPTIRVDGRDIALELRENRCGAEACACNGGIDCRVWVWQGEEYNEAPTAMIVDAVLGAVYGAAGDSAPAMAAGGAVPENLQRFFAATAPPAEASCCSPAEQSACCEPTAKAACCGTAATGGCGCK